MITSMLLLAAGEGGLAVVLILIVVLAALLGLPAEQKRIKAARERDLADAQMERQEQLEMAQQELAVKQSSKGALTKLLDWIASQELAMTDIN